MATSKFKGESPFKYIASRDCHESDYLYKEFSDSSKSKEIGKRIPLKLGLFGLGRAGTIHLHNIMMSPTIELCYVCDFDEERWESLKKRWNMETVTFFKPKDASKVLNDPSLDAIIVATPTYTHKEIILNGLKAGKHVFSEKPIGERIPEAKQCYEEADHAGKVLFCAFNRRFDPTFENIFERCRRGDIGHIQMIKVTSRDSPLPSLSYLKTSGGIFHDCAVHDIDMATWIIGELPEEVFVAANTLIPEIKDIDDFDNVAITLKFPSGTIGLIDISRFSSFGYDQRIEVFGAKGMIQAANEAPNSTVLSVSNGETRVPMYYSFPSRYYKGYQRELAHFVDLIEGRAHAMITSKTTLATSVIADACEKSAREGKPVKIIWESHQVPEDYF